MGDVARTLRAVPTLARVGLAGVVAYRAEFLIWVLSTNMPLVMLLLWTSVAREAPVAGFGEKDFAAYFLAALVVRLLTGSWVLWELSEEIRTGSLGMRLLRPIHPFVSFAVDNLAAVPARAALSLPIAVAALVWVTPGRLSHDPVQWLVAPAAVAGAWALTFGGMLAIGCLGLFWESSLAVYELWLALTFVLSGYIVPLRLFPAGVRAVVRWLPFPYVLSFPVETLLGTATRRETLVALGVQGAYVALFLAAALGLWKRGLVRFGAHGG